MAFQLLRDDELNRLEDELPEAISDQQDILRAIKQAGMNPGEVLTLPARAAQMWHEAVRYAVKHERLPLLLARVNAQLGQRRDADSLRRLIAAATERNASAVLAEEVRQLRTQADQLIG